MDDSRNYVLKVDFDRRLRLEFHGAKVTSDAGLLAYRELDDVFGLTEMAARRLTDSRTGGNTRHTMTALVRQAVLGRLAGYEDTNDADRLRVDPAMRHVVGGRAKELLGASTSEMSRLETELLARRENILGLMDLCGGWIDKVNGRADLKQLVLDMDSSESPTAGLRGSRRPSITASSTRPGRGRGRGAWSPRSSGTWTFSSRRSGSS